jgi:3-oxoacyl-[acyl-carrier-protein] synthase-1
MRQTGNRSMSSSPTTLCIAKAGMITSVGADTPMTAAAVCAGISQVSESVFHGSRCNPMMMASVSGDALPPINEQLAKTARLTARSRRMLQLGAQALAEMRDVTSVDTPLPLLLAGPETLAGCPAAIGGEFISQLGVQAGVEFDRGLSRLIATGRAGGLQAAELAFRFLEQTGRIFVLVGAVDSYCDPLLLGKLDAEDRIQTAGGADGFAPGEAAGFLLLATEDGMARMGGEPLGRVCRPGLADETCHHYSEEAGLGNGLAAAFAAALSQGGGGQIGTIYSSMNGESAWAREYGAAMTRNRRAFHEAVQHKHPAECFGDVGAAFGPVMIALAAIGMRNGYLRGPTLVYCSSDTGHRAAVCVH